MEPQLDPFLDDFCRKITTATLEQFEHQNLDYGTLVSEIMHHAGTIKAKCAAYVVREELKAKIESFLQSETSSSPFVVYGESGCGKTSFMAKSALDAKLKYPHAVVVTRFIGTSPQSSDCRSILYSIACQITQVYGGDVLSIKGDFKELSKLEFLAKATKEKPIIIFLDSLDQMNNDENAWDMSWMPEEGKLPQWVYLVVSTLPKEHEILQTLQSKYPTTQLENFLLVPNLDTETAQSIIVSHLKQANRTLTAEQLAKVTEYAKACPNPLYIRMVVDLCLKINSYHEIPTLPTTIKELINEILRKLERDHGDIVVSHALGYITCARNGLTETELDDILACDDDVISDLYQWWTPPERRMPPLLLARIISDLSGYLVMRGSRGHSVFAWYHRQWIEAVRERYLDSSQFAAHFNHNKAHAAVADYFRGLWGNGKKKPYQVVDGATKKVEIKEADRLVTPQNLYVAEGIPNIRKVAELPYHQLRCGDYKSMAEDSLGNIEFITAKIKAGLLYEMMEEYLQIETIAQSIPDDPIKEMQIYSRFVRQNAHILKTDAKATWQLALNQPDDTVVYREARSALPKDQFFLNWTNKRLNPVELIIDIQYRPKGEGLVNAKGNIFVIRSYETQVFSLQTGAKIAKIPGKLYEGAIALSFETGAELYWFLDSKLRIYNTYTGALIAQTTVLDGSNVLDYKLYLPSIAATQTQIFIWSGTSACVIDIPTAWSPTTQCRTHFFNFFLHGGGYQAAASASGVIFVENRHDSSGIVWYWGTEDSNLLKLFDDRTIQKAIISRSGKYLVVEQTGTLTLLDISDKHNPKVQCTCESRYCRAFYFSLDESHLLLVIQWGIYSVPVAPEAFSQNPKEVVMVIHSQEIMPFVEISPGKYLYCTEEAASIIDTSVPPIKTNMRERKYSLDGKSIFYYDSINARSEYVVIDATNNEQAEIYSVPSDSVMSPNFRIVARVSSPNFVLYSATKPEPIFSFEGYYFICFSPDEQMLCCYNKRDAHRITIAPVSQSMHNTVQALSLEVPHGVDKDYCSKYKFSRSNRYLFIYSGMPHHVSHLQVVDLITGKASFFRLLDVAMAEFSPNEKYLAIACSSHLVVYNLQESKIEFGRKKRDEDDAIRCVEFTPSDSEVVIFGMGYEVKWCSVKDGTLLYKFNLANLCSSISTNQVSDKILVSDWEGITYILEPIDIRKFEKSYGSTVPQLEYKTADTILQEVNAVNNAKDGNKNYEQLKSWMIDAQTYSKDSEVIVERFTKHLATRGPPSINNITSTTYAEAPKELKKVEGPAFATWASNSAPAPSQSHSFSEISTAMAPVQYFTEARMALLIDFAHKLVEIFNSTKSVEYVFLVKNIDYVNPVQSIHDDINKAVSDLCQRGTFVEDYTKKNWSGIPYNDEQLARLKEFGDYLRSVYSANAKELSVEFAPTKSHWRTGLPERAKSLDNDGGTLGYDEETFYYYADDNFAESLDKFAGSMKTVLRESIAILDPVDKVLQAAKEFNAVCPGYFYPDELEV